jgi:hypothetical protein
MCRRHWTRRPRDGRLDRSCDTLPRCPNRGIHGKAHSGRCAALRFQLVVRCPWLTTASVTDDTGKPVKDSKEPTHAHRSRPSGRWPVQIAVGTQPRMQATNTSHQARHCMGKGHLHIRQPSIVRVAGVAASCSRSTFAKLLTARLWCHGLTSADPTSAAAHRPHCRHPSRRPRTRARPDGVADTGARAS